MWKHTSITCKTSWSHILIVSVDFLKLKIWSILLHPTITKGIIFIFCSKFRTKFRWISSMIPVKCVSFWMICISWLSLSSVARRKFIYRLAHWCVHSVRVCTFKCSLISLWAISGKSYITWWPLPNRLWIILFKFSILSWNALTVYIKWTNCFILFRWHFHIKCPVIDAI